MSDKVLFVFEGKRTEPSIFKEISKIYKLDINDGVIFTFENCLYDLWKIITDDPDLDIIEVIRERNEKNKESLIDYKRSEISQVYFFFDLDSHDDKYNKNKVIDLLNTFSNETENGALFISYPMVEALRHIDDAATFHNKSVCCLNRINYKKIVHEEGHNKYKQINKINKNDLNDLLRLHIIKSNYICGIHPYPIDPDKFSKENISYIEQKIIFSAQIEKFIDPKSEVSVLSGFPLFLHQYFGSKIFEKIRNEIHF